MKKKIGNYKGDDLYLVISSYSNNGRIYLGLETKEDLYGDITINLSDKPIMDDKYIFLSGNISNELEDFLIAKGIITERIDIVQYNMGRYIMTNANFEKIKEYDPEGFNSISKDLELEDIEHDDYEK